MGLVGLPQIQQWVNDKARPFIDAEVPKMWEDFARLKTMLAEKVVLVDKLVDRVDRMSRMNAGGYAKINANTRDMAALRKTTDGELGRLKMELAQLRTEWAKSVCTDKLLERIEKLEKQSSKPKPKAKSK